MIRLRPYQREAVDAVFRAWRNGRGLHRVLISLPVGTGKTLVFGELARQMDTRTLILAHRGELLRQAEQKVKMIWPEAQIGYVQGALDEVGAPVVIASIQTLLRSERLERLQRTGPINLIILDEAHHYGARQYLHVLEQLNVFAPSGPLVVGVTATPSRADGMLAELFEDVVYERSILEMIRLGYLADLRGVSIQTRLDLSKVKVTRTTTTGLDWDEKALAHVVNKPWFNDLVVKVYLSEAADRKTVIFACSVEHSEILADKLCARGVRAAAVHGKLSAGQLRERLDAFASGALKVLVNCNLLVEGYDQPDVSCVMLARPTQSQVLYIQMVGRGVRLYPGKEDCLVVDFVGDADLGLELSSALGFERGRIQKGQSVLDVVEEEVRRERRQRARLRDVPPAREQEAPAWNLQRMDLFSRTQFRWLQTRDGSLMLGGGDAGNLYLIPTQEGFWRVYQVKDRVVRRLDAGEPLDITWAQGVAEDWIREHNSHRLADSQAKWRERPASDRQIEALKKLGITPGRLITAGQASDLLSVRYAERDLALIRKSGK